MLQNLSRSVQRLRDLRVGTALSPAEEMHTFEARRESSAGEASQAHRNVRSARGNAAQYKAIQCPPDPRGQSQVRHVRATYISLELDRKSTT